jgi:hypothetical protein
VQPTEENVDIVLGQLKRVLASSERIGFHLSDVRTRCAALETHARGAVALLGALERRLERFDARLARVERKLEGSNP